MSEMAQRARWLALHGFIRGLASVGARRGALQSRLIADPSVRADPVPFTEELRSRGRLVKGHGVFLTVDHQIAHDVLRSDQFRVAPLGVVLPRPLRWLEQKTRAGLWHPLEPPSLLSIEPPEHSRYRNLVRTVFHNRAVSALQGSIDDTTEELLEQLGSRAGVVDVVEDYCLLLPIAIMGDVLGVPADDRAHVVDFGRVAAPSLDFGQSWQQYIEVHRAIAAFDGWLARHLERLRSDPGDDLLSQLMAIEDGNGRLSDWELRATAGLMLAAGFETTVNLLANGIRILLDHPGHLQTLAERPELWRNAVEEIMRMDSPVQLTVRVAREDVEIDGTPVRRGDMVVIHLGGANRDPDVFEDPHRFDIARSNAGRHLSFSVGKHFCLGAGLARAEGQAGLRSFFTRYPDARLAGSGSRRDTRVLRGWSSLPVSLQPSR